jgi:hypothetical protein
MIARGDIVGAITTIGVQHALTAAGSVGSKPSQTRKSIISNGPCRPRPSPAVSPQREHPSQSQLSIEQNY